MWKIAIVIPVVLLLAGCKDTVVVEDNGPDRIERKEAMRDCVGEFRIEKAEYQLRIACTQAIYGSIQ
jgi:hypothetical protein|tara:strand:+ start:879 stop:1079 length:201 start_codon:yes stop_codon:yes gene_type:complete